MKKHENMEEKINKFERQMLQCFTGEFGSTRDRKSLTYKITYDLEDVVQNNINSVIYRIEGKLWH